MAERDYGRASREDYAEKHPTEKPEVDLAYERGEPQDDLAGLTKEELARLRRHLEADDPRLIELFEEARSVRERWARIGLSFGSHG